MSVGEIPTNWAFIKDIDFHLEFNTLVNNKIYGMQGHSIVEIKYNR